MRHGELLGLLGLLAMDWFLVGVLFNTSEPFGTLSHASTLLCVAYAIGLAIWHFMKVFEWATRH